MSRYSLHFEIGITDYSPWPPVREAGNTNVARVKCARACSNVLANGQNKSGYQVIVKGLSASAEGREPPHAGARERLAVAALSGKLRGVE